MNADTVAAGEKAEELPNCDLVMKGGVTSGLVYPKAVLMLKEHRRFRSIGGASAGAVAAALAAAAEHNRNGGGFEALQEVNDKLRGADEKGERPAYLRNLFQGKTVTEPLLTVVTNMASYLGEFGKIDTSKGFARLQVLRHLLSLIGRAVKESKVPGTRKGALAGTAFGFLFAALVAGFIALFFSAWKWLVFFGLLTVLGVALGGIGGYLGVRVAGLARLFRIVVTEVPRNYFGICSGLRDPDNKAYATDQPAATEWLHQSIQAIAGRPSGDESGSQVLTFSDLKSELKRGNPVELQFMVTNVSEGRPYTAPFDEPFLFKEAEFAELFPKPVVSKLKEKARKFAGVTEPPGYCFLPKKDDWPVVVAARMSMSFPLFFSSVPLYALPLWARKRIKNGVFTPGDDDFEAPPRSLREPVGPRTSVQGKRRLLREALEQASRSAHGVYTPLKEDLIPHWFSDGGIASNFPIHFFDQWLPKSPTFGITLRYLPRYLRDPRTPEEQRAGKHYLDSMEQATPREDIGRKISQSLDAQAAGSVADIVELPGAEDTVPPEWEHIHFPDSEKPGIGAAPAFLFAVIKTMQNYRDNTQAGLPSYRERVVQVRLGPEEGGFNLAMNRKLIDGLVGKGESAGTKLNGEFSSQHHQWARLRVLISELDAKFRKVLEDNRIADFQELVRKQSKDFHFPFHKENSDWCADVIARLESLREAMVSWKKSPQSVHLEAGEPPPALRVTPNV